MSQKACKRSPDPSFAFSKNNMVFSKTKKKKKQEMPNEKKKLKNPSKSDEEMHCETLNS